LGRETVSIGLLDPEASIVQLPAKEKGETPKVIIATDAGTLPGKGKEAPAAEGNKGEADKKAEATVAPAKAPSTLSTVLGVGATAVAVVAAKELVSVINKEGKALAGTFGGAVKEQWNSFAKAHGYAATALKVVAIGGLIYAMNNYALEAGKVDTDSFVEEFINKSYSLTATKDGCQPAVREVQKLIAIDKKAVGYRQKIAAIDEQLAATTP
jgi:hypothetical protein